MLLVLCSLVLVVLVMFQSHENGFESVEIGRMPRDIHHPNLALSMVTGFAVAMNYSHCWICQHLPHSTTSAMWMPIPLTKEELIRYQWQDLLLDKDCYSDTRYGRQTEQLAYPYLTQEVLGVVSAVSTAVNKEHLPVGWNVTDIFRLVAYERLDWALEGKDMVFKIDTTHAQTNCTRGSTSSNCKVTEVGTRLKCSSEVLYHAEKVEFQVGFSQCVTHPCHPEVRNDDQELRSSSGRQTLNVVPLFNVSYCFTGYQGKNNLTVSLGKGSCDTTSLMYTNLDQPANLPKSIYAVCEDRAYTHLPAGVQGECYLAHIVPMIRRVNMTEIQASYSQHVRGQTRKKRSLTWWQKVLGVLIPSYGTYNSQVELEALSTILEKHMNASDAAIQALATEVDEIKTVSLQNRMVLDIMLADKGGACKVIGTECCSYVSDPSKAIYNLHLDTRAGVADLHKNHDGVFWGSFGSWFGGIGGSLTHTLVLIVVTVVVLCLVFCCISACIKVAMSNFAGSVSGVMVQLQVPMSDWMPPFNDSEIV